MVGREPGHTYPAEMGGRVKWKVIGRATTVEENARTGMMVLGQMNARGGLLVCRNGTG